MGKQFGDHVEQNLTAATLYVKRASDAGSADGLLLMGFVHSLGLGVRKDLAKVPAGAQAATCNVQSADKLATPVSSRGRASRL